MRYCNNARFASVSDIIWQCGLLMTDFSETNSWLTQFPLGFWLWSTTSSKWCNYSAMLYVSHCRAAKSHTSSQTHSQHITEPLLLRLQPIFKFLIELNHLPALSIARQATEGTSFHLIISLFQHSEAGNIWWYCLFTYCLCATHFG